MILRYLYHRGLAQASYLLGCSACGEALIVDPNRDIDQYIELAEREGLTITGITETHVHADYVSGARELAARTGATLYLSGAGPAEWKYEFAKDSGATLINDGDTIMVGNIKVEVWHTPGHTPEHVSFLVTDAANADRPMGMFTGDFVFVGDVGRPDLLEKAAGQSGTMEAGARLLYQSLQRFKQLPDFVQVWPGHGAGSACGKALGAVPQTTVGYERLFNWAFRAKTEEAFVDGVLAEQPEPPMYFKEMKRINKEGPAIARELPDPETMEVQDLVAALDRDEVVVDTRPSDRYQAEHIPATINIPFEGSFVTWAGWLVPYDKPFHVIADDHQIGDVVHELRMIGLDNLSSYAPVSILENWTASGRELETASDVSVEELSELGDYEIVDVRGASEYADEHVPGSKHIPLGYLRQHLEELPEGKPVVVHCQSGARSAIAQSVAMAGGSKNVLNLSGGFNAWKKSGKSVETERETASVA